MNGPISDRVNEWLTHINQSIGYDPSKPFPNLPNPAEGMGIFGAAASPEHPNMLAITPPWASPATSAVPGGDVGPQGDEGGSGGGFNSQGFNRILGFAEGGRPEAGQPAMVGEQGPEVFVPDQPGTVIPSGVLQAYPWLEDALTKMPAPAPQPRMYKGREVADWSRRDPEAEVAQSKQRWADIYADPASTLEYLGTTGQIIGAAIRNAAPNRAEAAPLGGKKPAASPDAIMLEQQKLKEAGFYNGDIDGVEGPGTVRARKEYAVAQEKLAEQKLEADRIKAQSDTAAAQTELAKAQAEAAKSSAAATAAQEAARVQKAKEREEGQETLRKSDKDIGFFDRLIRDYGTGAGIAIGAAAGPMARAGVKKIGDIYNTGIANKAEQLFEGTAAATPKIPVGAKNLTQRVGNVNDYWRLGGAQEVPFLPTPGVKPGMAVNPGAASLESLYKPSFMSTKGADAAAVGAMGTEAGVAAWQKQNAQEALDRATIAVKEDPSEINIREYQAAKTRVATMDLLMNIGRTGAGSYVLGGMAKPRQPIKPATNVAETEKLDIEKLLRDTADRAARAEAKKTAKPATPSLASLTEPRPAVVPKRTKKAAE